MDDIMYDNGPPYSGKEWKKWTKRWNIEAKNTTLYHPQANRMVERHNASLKKTIHAAIAEGKDRKKAAKEFNFAYRNTPHLATGEKPSKKFFNRDINEKIPAPVQNPQENTTKTQSRGARRKRKRP